MSVWEGAQRATVPSSAMQSSEDILPATPSTASQSPFPLGLGFSIAPTDSSSTSDAPPLPLFYVSPVAAALRAPSAHVQNPPGVRPGWYVLAKCDETFRVHISLVNDTIAGNPHETYMSTSLYVDGASTHSYKVFCNTHPRREYTELGFVQRDNKGEQFKYRRALRPFVFRKAASERPDLNDEHLSCSTNEIGTVKLRVYVGPSVPRKRNDDVMGRNYEVPQKISVSEKAAIKHGKSLRLAADGPIMDEKCSLSAWTTEYKRRVTAAGVEVFVREHCWLRSRRIIDDKGDACSEVKFRALLKEDGAQGVKRDDRPDLKKENKRIKVQPVIIELDALAKECGVAAEVVDLT